MAEKGKTADKQTAETSGGFLNSIRLSRASAIEITALGLIIIVAIILRVLLLRWGDYLNEYDPFFFYRISEYIAKNGYGAYFTWHDTLSWYPMGRDIAVSSYPGNPFSAVFIYQLLNAIQIKIALLDVAMYFPVFMAAVVCVIAYFFGKDFGGKATGIFTSLLMAISPSYIGRTVAGFFDTENIGIFGIVATPFFFLRSIQTSNSLPKRVVYAIAGGIAMGYAFASWGAARYISSLLLLYIIVMLVMGKIEQRHIISYSITTIVGFLIALVVPRLGVSYILNIENIAALGAIGLLIVYEVIKTRMPESKARIATLGLVALALAAFIILPYIGIGNPITGKFLKVINPFEDAGALYSSVGENKVSSWSVFFSDFGITIVLAVLGAYFILKEGGDSKYYVLIFFLTAVYFAGTVVRLTLILAFPASLLAGYALVELIEPFRSVFAQQDDAKSRRRKAQVVAVSKGLGLIFIVILFGSLIPHALNATSTAASPGPLVQSSVPVLFNGAYANDWIKTLNWINANTTPGSVICSWWDYGYWIETMANRTTLADGSTLNRTQIVNIANMMMRPQNVSLPLMKKFNVDYVVVFITFNPNNSTQEWPFGDNAKWPQMANIAGLNVTDYYSYNSQTSKYQYTTKYTNTTIAGLMYGIADQSHFTRVYRSPLGWVLVYKVKY
ncbi:MAG: STT3 domain-containing protein [Candidatus Bathyarchaeia archaeon]|jgi:dolichyl-diphosphooligosaccharide--protein glycosyltransferase